VITILNGFGCGGEFIDKIHRHERFVKRLIKNKAFAQERNMHTMGLALNRKISVAAVATNSNGIAIRGTMVKVIFGN